MRCSNCGSDNSTGKRFCGDCGAPLENHCPKCGAQNPAGKRFCGDCGASLDAATPPATEPRVATEPRYGDRSGERRHLTVLFCDLVNSTEIAAQLDPEEWREVVGRYHRAAADMITGFGGHVAKYLGDGVMAYFGWPEAHDNDAERGVRAGLAIQDAISKLNQPITRTELSARIGIDSGTVVVGASAGKDADVFGDTPNIAARVQAAAEPGTLVITDATHRLVSGLFVVEERGAQELKGVANPVELYRILRPSGVRGRLAAARGLTPFVGREEELRLLLSRWERAREGEGQLVLIAGEAGIGKSRLVAEFRDRIRDTPHLWMESAGEQFFQNTPFHAITEMLSQWLVEQGATNPDDRIERLERALVSAGLKPEDAAPLIVDLLQLPVQERYPAIALTPEQNRRRLLAALTGWVFGAARFQPVVMVVEDLHWLDPSTLELVQLVADQAVTVAVMLICTTRPEFHPQSPMRSHHTQITMNRLSVRNVREMVALVAARNALASESVEAVIQRTGGVPLFVEELTRAVLESGDVKLSGRAIPVTLHDSLMARLDRLGSAKSVLQLGSVIGGEFSFELLRAVHPGSESELESELRKLTDADLLYFRGVPPDATYRFKHALIRDAAYEALLKSRRKELHGLIARTIDEKFPDVKQAQPEVLARHWTEAGELEPAIAEWSRAGKAAQARNAFAEAEKSYEQALRLLDLLPESTERDLRELELRQSTYVMLTMANGWAAPETVNVTERITALAEKSGNLTSLGYSLLLRGLGAWAAGDLATASALADQALKLALREGKSSNIAGRYWLNLMVRYWYGDLAGAEQHFLAGLAYFEDPVYRQAPIGGPPNAFGWGALTAWALGRPQIARERLAKTMAVADRNNPGQLTESAFMAALVHLTMREYAEAEALAARAVELSQQHQLPNYTVAAQCFLGEARAQLGRTTEGIALLREGIAGMLRLGVRLASGIYSVWLAEAESRQGANLDGLKTIEQALEANPDELKYWPEALRVRGELRAQQGATEAAENDIRDAITLAQTKGAKAWELRATTSLARLLASKGLRDEARTMLAEIYGWFTEGFDTVDLKEAKMLLEELGGTGARAASVQDWTRS
jgi:class 3 adenylate cyclase/tetratricopeptide (TPR) repeat protein